MRFGSEKNGRWSMGCRLASSTFTPKVLRFGGMREEVRVPLEAHLLAEVATYTALCSKAEVEAKLHQWVEDMRATNPGFWPKKTATGLKRGAEKMEKGSSMHEKAKKAMRVVREQGKHWAGAKGKDLQRQGYSRSLALVGKPYIARLLEAHQRCA